MEFVSYDIESNDFRRAGAASRAIKEHLKRIGADAEAIRRTMIASYEAEMNVVIHSLGGRLEASLNDVRIDVNVVDEGPGIPDIDLAMTEGYSTASTEARALGFGAGMGLPNIKRSSDQPAGDLPGGRGHTRELHRVPAAGDHVRGSCRLPLRRCGPVPRLPGVPYRLPHAGPARTGRQTSGVGASVHRLQPSASPPAVRAR